MRSPQTQHVLVELGVGVGERRRADRVQGGDDGHPLGHHLLRLLGGRALPDAERAGRLAADRGGERHRAVDQDLARPQRLAQVVEVLRLGAEGDGEEDDLGLLGGLLVLAGPRPSAPGTFSRSFAAASSARSAEREPSTIGAPALAQRSARPAPRAPVPPMIGMVGSSATGRPVYAARRMRLEGRKALVTGGASGIGAAIAARLAAEGAEVWVGDIDTEGAAKVAGEVNGHAIELDVTDLESARAAVEAAGTLDILVNNAGTDEFGFFTYTTPEQWQKVLAINLGGVLNCTHAALPGDAAGQIRPHPQHLLRGGPGRLQGLGRLLGRQGRRSSASPRRSPARTPATGSSPTRSPPARSRRRC